MVLDLEEPHTLFYKFARGKRAETSTRNFEGKHTFILHLFLKRDLNDSIKPRQCDYRCNGLRFAFMVSDKGVINKALLRYLLECPIDVRHAENRSAMVTIMVCIMSIICKP